MRHTEFWDRLEGALGAAYARHWAGQFALTELGSRTAVEALADGESPKRVWRAVWKALDLPAVER